MRLLAGLALIHVLLACNPGSKLMKGRNSSSETASTAAPESTEHSVDTSVLESAETYSDVASEPVSVGGAFLTCVYKSGQPQGNASYQMDCDVGPIAEVTSTITSAEFFKVDSQGTRSALAISVEDLTVLKWTILETASTLPYNKVEVVLKADNATPASLTTTITAPLVLTQVTTFWLGGEPNNITTLNPEGEDCVEFGNIAAKTDHQNRTGFVVGPYGRMNDIGCTARNSNFLCRSLSGDNTTKWVLSTVKGIFQESTNACPLGYSFGFPINEKEVSEVGALIDGNPAIQNIWVNMSDRMEEGKFSILYR